MQWVRAIIRGLAAALVLLALSGFSFLIAVWLGVEDHSKVDVWFHTIAFAAVFCAYLLLYVRTLREAFRKDPRLYIRKLLSLVSAMVLPFVVFSVLLVGVVMHFDHLIDAVYADIPIWLQIGLYAATMVAFCVAAVDSSYASFVSRSKQRRNAAETGAGA